MPYYHCQYLCQLLVEITAIAGIATCKNIFCISICKHFLDKDKNAAAIYFESESAISKDMLENRGIDSRVVYACTTVQEFRNQSIKIADKYLEQEKDKRKPINVCIR